MAVVPKNRLHNPKNSFKEASSSKLPPLNFGSAGQPASRRYSRELGKQKPRAKLMEARMRRPRRDAAAGASPQEEERARHEKISIRFERSNRKTCTLH